MRTIPLALLTASGLINAGVVAVATDSGPASYPAFQGTNPLTIFQYGYEAESPWSAQLDMLNAHDLVSDPEPEEPYVLYRVTFDHSESACGEVDPDLACGHLDRPAHIWISYTEFLRPDLSLAPFALRQEFAYWQEPGCPPDCPAVQAQSSTWGRVKGLYR